MSNQQLYNQHRNNGVPHDEAAAALGVSQDAGRMLKSRYNKAQATKNGEPKKAKAKVSIFDAARTAPVGTTLTKQTPNGQIWVTRESENGALAYDSEVLRDFAKPSKRSETPQAERKPKQRRFTMPTAETLRSVALDVLLIAVVVGHAGLVWFDTADRWGLPGMIGGGVVFLIVLAALLLASDETKPRTSEAALWFVFLTDFAAWFVHFPVFKDRAQIGDIETGVFAGFLCAASFTALYLYRDSKLA